MLEGGISILRVIFAWPVVALVLIFWLRKPLFQFFDNLSELTFKAGGVEASARRSPPLEAAALLGAAQQKVISPFENAPQFSIDNAGKIAKSVQQALKPQVLRRLQESRVLWVDDRPRNNVYERKALEILGITIDLSTSTEDALDKIGSRKYAAIISDMGRPPDPKAGYTLLDTLRSRGDKTPFVIYAGSNAPEHKAEAREHGAVGSTNQPQELFDLVLNAIKGD